MATQRYRSIWAVALCLSVFLTALFMWGNSSSRASGVPKIDRENTVLKGGKKKGFVLEVVGDGFQQGATVEMEVEGGGVFAKGEIKFVNPNKLEILNVDKKDFPKGIATISVRNPDGSSSAKETIAIIPSAIGPSPLSVADIQRIIAQGAAAALKLNVAATFAVLDREGNVLALYQMKGANKAVLVRDLGTFGQGLEGVGGPGRFPGVVKSQLAAMSKAGVGAFFGTFGNAFSTRTAAYIIREHIPPFIDNMPGGPLFGVQISSLACSDIKQPGLPLGLAGDPGGFPLYKNGIPAGGIGVEINGIYGVCLNRAEDLNFHKGNKDKKVLTPDNPLFVREFEEFVALAALRGYEAPDEITGDKILVNGIRLPYALEYDFSGIQSIAFNQIPGKLLAIPETGREEIRSGVKSEFRDIILRDTPVRVVNRFFPFKDSPTRSITKADVEQMLFQATKEANRVRAAIRRPIEVPAEVNISVVNEEGTILGIVSTPDAPVFGFDVSTEKIRSAVFFSRGDALSRLRLIGLSKYAQRFEAEAFPIGQFFLTSRSIGAISRPFYPDGIMRRQDQGAPILASEPADFSPLNNGFQTDYLLTGARGGDPLSFILARSIVNTLTGKRGSADQFYCDASNGRAGDVLNNTLMIFSGSTLAFKGGRFVGGVGISGDGIDQDNIIAAYGVVNFEVPDEKRADRVFYRGIRLPYNKFPRHPHIGEEGDDNN
jgi:uncharacterized protein GlcG (DUF336 family)